MKTCWSPCFWHPNVKSGSMAVALYTLLMSLVMLTYTIYIMTGGESSQFYLPLFEANSSPLNPSLQHAGRFLAIYFTFMAIVSVILMFGIRSDIRGLMIPWMAGMFLICLFQATFGCWLVFGYYIYLESVFAALVDWAWMAYNIYCYYVVRSHYRNVKWFQSPDIEVLDDYAK